ncbi:MAG: anhydro-N-acetylmuramic acid kinase [Pseudomonadota bacterium]
MDSGDRFVALGLMSGTSMDGIDIAAITTDGTRVLERHGGQVFDYSSSTRSALEAGLQTAWTAAKKTPALDGLGQQITRLHSDAVAAFLQANPGLEPDLIGFHGHTVLHQPHRQLTWQIGDGQLLANMTGLPVVWDMRSNDVAKGGEGAPLACAYHAAVAADLERPIAVLNLGGVANITWIGADGTMLAMDCGPANALMDMWVAQHDKGRFDGGGRAAAAGAVRADIVATMADNPFFDQAPPKSLDRLDFDLGPVRGLPYADGLATLAAFTAESVWMAQTHFPAPAARWLVTGGGRHNPTLMGLIAKRLSAPVAPIETAGFDGDLLEAEAFAFLAARAKLGLPLSYPGTTGVPEPMTGGVLSLPA